MNGRFVTTIQETKIMIMRITKTYDVDVDFDKERKRIIKRFKGDMRKRLLNILDLFLAGKSEEMNNEYDALPYCEKHGCPGQEFMGMWWWRIGEPRVIPKVKIEVKTEKEFAFAAIDNADDFDNSQCYW